MTETVKKPERNLAEVIRSRREVGGEMFDLSAQAQRLSAGIRVAEKWVDDTVKHAAPYEMTSQAEMIRDQLEEELARVAYEMEVLRQRREYKDMGREEVPERVIDNALLSDTMLEAYCILSAAPEEIFIAGARDEGSTRTRYRLMGALLAAQGAANAEMERAEG